MAAEEVMQSPLDANVEAARQRKLALRLPKDEKVTFRGSVNYDNAGAGTLGMLYPAPNAVGFLAGLITHGILLQSTKKNQKDKLQEAADSVQVIEEGGAQCSRVRQ